MIGICDVRSATTGNVAYRLLLGLLCRIISNDVRGSTKVGQKIMSTIYWS
jgi:hypothetical protein